MPVYRLFSFSVLFILNTYNASSFAVESMPYQAVTTRDTNVDIDELEFALVPLIQSEVKMELQAWLIILKEQATIVSEAEILVNQEQKQIKTSEKISSISSDSAQLVKPDEQEIIQQTNDNQELDRNLVQLKSLSQALPETTTTKIVNKITTSAENLTKLSNQAYTFSEQLQKKRTLLIKSLTDLKEAKRAVLDRFIVVLNNFVLKGGDGTELQLYANAIESRTVDLSDANTAILTMKEWLKSKEGGLLWLGNTIKFFIAIFIVYLLSGIASKATKVMLSRNKTLSELLKQFIQTSIRRVILSIGFLVSLSILEINIGPVLALIGAAGLVIGLALQNTLSNFASGMLILIYRPYDIGDVIGIDGVTGIVDSMTLLSTAIKTFDNQHLIVPNNNVWGNTITNITGSKTRRVDLVFGIGYDDDMNKAQSIMEQVLSEHELVLSNPKPTIKVHELADSSVNFICRPWVKTADYWNVYWDITRQVKEQFDLQGVTIPFPQRDVYIHQSVQEK